MTTGLIDAQDRAGVRPRTRSDAPIIDARMVRVMACVCVTAIGIAAFGRLTGVGVQQLPRAPVVEARDILFADAGRGVVEVRDNEDKALIRSIGPGEGNFLRTVMRGLAHDRMARGGDSSTPFRLTLRENGHLIISDPMTSREVILDSFGKPNRDAFGALLRNGGSAARSSTIRAAGAVQPQGDTK